MLPVLALAAMTALAAPPDAKKHGWLTDYPTALAAAKKSGKPLMVVFRCVP